MPRGFTPYITLTTDFGDRDGFVGAMKGVILSINPNAKIIDLTHDIPRQDVVAGAMVVRNACAFFPEGTIHLVVVDPGVGTTRHEIVAETGNGIFVLPDNGLLTLFHRTYPVSRVHLIENPALLLNNVSNTFHGRDIFAPVAAHLSMGTPLDKVGRETQEMNLLDIAHPTVGEGWLEGEIIYEDIYGNLCTNIEKQHLDSADSSGKTWVMEAGGAGFSGLHRTFAEVPVGEPLILFGSSGFLEIAVNGGSAAEMLQLDIGTQVLLRNH